MIAKLKTAPATEPVSLLEMKNHLRLISSDFGGYVASNMSISPGLHTIAAGYTLVGASVDVADVEALVSFDAGECGSGGTVDVKIQHSDDNTTWEDWTGGAFTQVTTANDNATYEKQYTGAKAYIRTVATVATAGCSFGTNVITGEPENAEDDLIEAMITEVRTYIEDILNRALITQTYQVYYDEWPEEDYLELSRGRLQSVTSLKYTDSDGVVHTVSTDDYAADTVREPGRIKLKYGKSWPTDTLNPLNPIVAEIVVGYGNTSSTIPGPLKLALKIAVAKNWANREDMITGTIVKDLGWLDRYIAAYRIMTF